jgi:hypothetical protein
MPIGKKLGLLPEREDSPRLPPLHEMVRVQNMPPVPPSGGYGLRISGWGMLGNDLYGDCTCAAVGHSIRAFTSWSRVTGAVQMTTQQALKLYSAVTKPPFDPNVPSTDTGAVMTDVLSYWWHSGVDVGLPALDHLNGFAGLRTGQDAITDLRRSIAWSGQAMISVNLPNNAFDQEIWEVEPDDGGSAGGHEVLGMYYNPNGVVVITWGEERFATNAWLEKYMTAGQALLSADGFRANGLDPDHSDMAQLSAAMSAFRPASS